MKRIIVISAIALSVLFQSCEKSIESFDNETNYIYFNRPFAWDYSYNRYSKERVDSLYYSFSLDDASVTSYTFKIPVNTMGLENKQDRTYLVEAVADKTTATSTEWSTGDISNLSVKAGRLDDVIMLTVNRTPILKNEWRRIVLRVLPNENFEVGVVDMQTITLTFSDIPAPPDWWNTWFRYFGDYVKEKYLKWQEIYYLGADPNMNTYGNGEQLYWGNMPSSAMESWYPSTFLFIRILKQYFLDNEVYPDGDTSQPRIMLP